MKISIVTPSLNAEQFIDRTIQSVLNQRGNFDLEYIVVDGGSTDGTHAILAQYEDRLTLINEHDDGQAEAINRGFRLATGDVIAFLNTDDTYELGALALVGNFFSQSDRLWAFGRCHIINEEGKRTHRWITEYKNLFLRRYSYSKLLAENFISQPAVFWRRDVLERVGELNEAESYVFDYEYWLRLGATSAPGFIDAYLASFRWHPYSKSWLGFRQQFVDELRVAKSYADGRTLPIAVHQLNYYKIVLAYSVMRRIKRQQ